MGTSSETKELFLAALRQNSIEPLPSGKGWKCQCPAHDDTTPSLSISVGTDGRLLLYCHAGCSVEAICSSIGHQVADLFIGSGTQYMPCVKRMSVTSVNFRDVTDAFVLAMDMRKRDELALRLGLPTEALEHLPQIGYDSKNRCFTHTETDAGNNPIGIMQRYKSRKLCVAGSKRGIYITKDWSNRPGALLLVEGASDALAVAHAGIACLGRPSNIGGVDHLIEVLKDFPLDREIIVVGENDEGKDGSHPGKTGAIQVAGELCAELNRIIYWSLPPAPAKDSREWLISPNRGELSWDQRGRDYLDKLQANAVAVHPPISVNDGDENADTADMLTADKEFRPIPVHVLPTAMKELAKEGASAIGCDPSYIVLAALAVLASAIGTSVQLQVKPSWRVYAILWMMTVGESGTSKTSAFKLATKPLDDLTALQIAEHQAAMAHHREAKVQFEKGMQAWKQAKSGCGQAAPTMPSEPLAKRCLTQDPTVEALVSLLLANPRGLLLARDELEGMIASLDQYKPGGKGGDAAHYLSMHNGGSITMDRKSSGASHVPKAFVSICGGIQPAVLQQTWSARHRESGMSARFLYTFPPRITKKWTDNYVSHSTINQWELAIEQVFTLKNESIAKLSPEAKVAYSQWYDRHNKEQSQHTGLLAAAYSKIEEAALRLALVIHVGRWACGEILDYQMVDDASMLAGITLADWFKNEAHRVYSMFSNTKKPASLLEWLREYGNPITPREIGSKNRNYRGPGGVARARIDLEKLVEDEDCSKNPDGTYIPSARQHVSTSANAA